MAEHEVEPGSKALCSQETKDEEITQCMVDLLRLNDALSRCLRCPGSTSAQCGALEIELRRKHGIAPLPSNAEVALRFFDSIGFPVAPCATCVKLRWVLVGVAAKLSRLLD